MNFLVIGLGSMGKRRIRLLKNNFPKINIFGVDSNLERGLQVGKEFDIKIFNSITHAVNNTKIDASLICTSPITHEGVILECLNYDFNIFTEINLINSYYEQVIKLAKSKGLKVYLSSTFLKRKEIKFIRNQCADKKVTYRYHAGQYLPDWHPWESYKDYFVSNKITNACREILAIELPWLISCFGKVQDIKVFKTKLTSLEIDYDDTYQILIQHSTGVVGSLTIDVVSRVPKRDFEVFGETCQIFWDGTPGGLLILDSDCKTLKSIQLYDCHEQLSQYTQSIIEDAYLEEIKEFVNYLVNDSFIPEYSFEQDYEVIEVINNIENQL